MRTALTAGRPGAARWIAMALLVALGTSSSFAQDPAPEERKALRVCQDPNNLPFSNSDKEGIENKIAEAFGRSLGLPVVYFWYPQRFAFVRNTLKYKLPGQDYPCDVMLGVPVGFDQVSVTKPYYRSTYALVFPQGKGLDSVRTDADFLALDPAQLAKLRIGIYNRSPASAWLAKHGLVDIGVPYNILNADPQQYPGEIIVDDLASGKIDAAIVWGPIAGYFAKRLKTPVLTVVPLHSEPGVRLDYQMAMGVRYGEREWKQQIEALIDSNKDEIAAILKDFGVPLVDDSYSAGKP
jgi:quinoprotein dehydrogenase-associated probable ABC transporter substrate-binding protein